MTGLDPQQRRRKALDLRAEGLSFRKIGQQLGVSHEHARRLTQVTSLTSVRSRGEAFRDHVLDAFELDGPETELLEEVCRLLDRADELQAAIDADGVVVTSARGDRRVHPAVSKRRQVSLAIGRLLGQLDCRTRPARLCRRRRRRGPAGLLVLGGTRGTGGPAVAVRKPPQNADGPRRQSGSAPRRRESRTGSRLRRWQRLRRRTGLVVTG